MHLNVLRCLGNVFSELLPRNDRGTHRHTVMLRAFFAVGKCLPSRCLAMEGGINFTETLPSNDRRDKHTDAQTDGRDL
jgi:hypothetical protein